jgi:hypothetical protein
VSTPHGAIEVAWKFEGKKVRLGLGVLVGVEGVLELLRGMGSEETGMPRQWDLESDKLEISPMKYV